MDIIKETYLSDLRATLADMRLLIEGAICLYEDDAPPAFTLSKEHGQQTAVWAIDTIGYALYDLRMQIISLQNAFPNETATKSTE